MFSAIVAVGKNYEIGKKKSVVVAYFRRFEKF